jgi:hypothetical protein
MGNPIDDVITRMQAIDAALPRKDGVAIFNRLYLAVTKAVDAASAGVSFEDPQYLERLDVLFAGLYFDAEATIASGLAAPVAWAPLIESRATDVEPIQFALAGMSAHINHDLAVAVVRTSQERDVEPADGSPQHADFLRVNAILSSVEGQVAGWFETGLIADIEDVTPKAADRALAMWSIAAARDIAWDNAKALWALRGTRLLQDGYDQALARSVAMSCAALLI